MGSSLTRQYFHLSLPVLTLAHCQPSVRFSSDPIICGMNCPVLTLISMVFGVLKVHHALMRVSIFLLFYAEHYAIQVHRSASTHPAQCHPTLPRPALSHPTPPLSALPNPTQPCFAPRQDQYNLGSYSLLFSDVELVNYILSYSCTMMLQFCLFSDN